MKAFVVVQRIQGVLLARCRTLAPWPWHAASQVITRRSEAPGVLRSFVDELRRAGL